MPKKVNLLGKTVGDLTVIAFDTERSCSSSKNYWLCRCKCGNIKSVEVSKLTGKLVRSCGCRQYEGNHKTHGKTDTRIYKIWCKMKARCNTPSAPHYEYYGGIGIRVCDEWCNSFESFYKWAMDSGYNDSLSIDRIDPFGNYCPDNCRWATRLQQARNKRNTVYVKIGDSVRPASYYADKYGIPTRIISERYKRLLKSGKPITEENLSFSYVKKEPKVRVNQFTKDGKLIKSWNSYAEIEKANVGHVTGVRMCCLGKWSSAYGYIWRFAE